MTNFETPILTALAMAEFMMTCHTKKYRQENLAYLAEIHEVEYVELVKKLIIEIQQKGKK